MTLTNILADLYRRLNFTTTPPAATTTRLTAFINDAHRQMLTIPGMERLRDDTITFASVASQPRYTLPQNVARIKAIVDRANMRRIQFLSLDQLRSLDPGQTASGSSDWYTPIGYQAVAKQPAAATGLWVVSTLGADTTQTAFIETVRTGGSRYSTSATLNGLTRVQFGNLTDHIEVTKFYVSAATAGTVKLFDAAAAGNELAQFSVLTYSRYFGIQLFPTPSAAVTYSVDYTRTIPEMVNGGDEPLLPEDFHYVLVLAVLVREYEKTDDTRWSQALAEYREGVKALRSWVLYPPDFNAVPGPAPIGSSNLGGWYPRSGSDW
jgi:hypothetical protein